MIHAELIHSIFIEVGKLPEKQREVFNMTYLEDKTVEEIAEELQMSPASVYTNRSRAIHTIRTLLGTKNALTLLAFLSLVGEN
jgi:RNA polymerase sigma-70 factor (ECF subfamily)